MAPIAAGPAPSRKARARWLVANAIEVPRAEEDEGKRRRERDGNCEQCTADARGRVPDHRDGEHDRTGRELAQRNGVEELRVGHPVVVTDRIGLHQRDDDESTAVGEGADLQRDPHDRDQHAAADSAGREQRDRSDGRDGRTALARRLRNELDRAAAEEDEHEPRADGRRGECPEREVRQPSNGRLRSRRGAGARTGGPAPRARRPPRRRHPHRRSHRGPTAVVTRPGTARRARR